jgi:hypothetical protein
VIVDFNIWIWGLLLLIIHWLFNWK